MASQDEDQVQAAREADARGLLLEAGAALLPRPPWVHEQQPPAATDLIRFAVWRANAGRPAANASDPDANAGGIGEEGVLAALSLLAAARAELDHTEAALLFTARSRGLSWPRISRAMGLGSPQAAQQRFDRVSGRAQRPAGQ
ncbi:MAG TPA: DNA-binding protein [Streptosporangiaceae bacterium]|nr:DNA-binding protein [Streptosporangiaceae bacterium]